MVVSIHGIFCLDVQSDGKHGATGSSFLVEEKLAERRAGDGCGSQGEQQHLVGRVLLKYKRCHPVVKMQCCGAQPVNQSWCRRGEGLCSV